MSQKGQGDLPDRNAFENMTNKELEDILCADYIDNTDGPNDIVLQAMEVLSKRKRESGDIPKLSDEAYREFEEHYRPNSKHVKECKVRLLLRRSRRSFQVIAAGLLVILFCAVSAEAFKGNLAKVFVEWTKDTVSFIDTEDGYRPTSECVANYNEQLQGLMQCMGARMEMLPQSLTQYSLINIIEEESPDYMSILALYRAEKGRKLKLSIRRSSSGIYEQIEQSDNFIEEYPLTNSVAYILKDNKQYKAVWFDDGVEFYIASNISLGELKNILNTIEED